MRQSLTMSRKDYERLWHRRRYEKLRERGLCVHCGRNEAIEGQVLCESCKAARATLLYHKRLNAFMGEKVCVYTKYSSKIASR